jgi:hypothetical protein
MAYLKQYFAAIWEGWLSRMSTIASVLFIIVALVFRLTEIGQARYWIGAAVASYAIASFSAWRKERLSLERLDRVVKSMEQSTGQAVLSPGEIVKVYEGRTTIAGAKLASAYIGNSMTVTANVEDVSSPARITLFVDGILIFLHFEESLGDAVSALQKGDSITACGQITTVEKTHVSLDECKLIKF